MRVEDAHGMAPTIPFWPGEADELSRSVSRRRSKFAGRLLADPEEEDTVLWLGETVGIAAPDSIGVQKGSEL